MYYFLIEKIQRIKYGKPPFGFNMTLHHIGWGVGLNLKSDLQLSCLGCLGFTTPATAQHWACFWAPCPSVPLSLPPSWALFCLFSMCAEHLLSFHLVLPGLILQ